VQRIEVTAGVRGKGEEHRTGYLGHTSFKFIMFVCVCVCMYVCMFVVCMYVDVGV
jgi:hypothetical protein